MINTERELIEKYESIRHKVQSILPHNYYKQKISEIKFDTINDSVISSIQYAGIDNLGKFIEYLVLFKSSEDLSKQKFEKEDQNHKFLIGIPRLNGKSTVYQNEDQIHKHQLTYGPKFIHTISSELSEKGYIPSSLNEIYNVQFRDRIQFKNPLMNQK